MKCADLFGRTEESGGPTATCEITTYQTEPHLSLEINSDIVYVSPKFHPVDSGLMFNDLAFAGSSSR